MDSNKGRKKQIITLEHTVISNMPQRVDRFRLTIKNPQKAIRLFQEQLIKQAEKILLLQGFARGNAAIFNETMKKEGGKVVGVCPFSAN